MVLWYRVVFASNKPLQLIDKWLESVVNGVDEASRFEQSPQKPLSQPPIQVFNRAVAWIIQFMPDPVCTAWWCFRIRQILEEGWVSVISSLRFEADQDIETPRYLDKLPIRIRNILYRPRALLNNYRNRRIALLQLPPEILEEIVFYCDDNFMTARKGDFPERALIIVDSISRTGAHQIQNPCIPAVAQTCSTLRYISWVTLFKDSYIQLTHSDIQGTLAWFKEQHPNALRGVGNLVAEVQRQRPVDYHAFSRVCRSLSCMSGLKRLSIWIPIEGCEYDYTVEPEPGLANALRWHWNQFKAAVWKDYSTMRGYGWENDPNATWVRDLLPVNQGQLKLFRLGCVGRNPPWIGLFLEKTMLEPWPVRKTYVDAMKHRKREWTKRPSFGGVSEYLKRMRN